MVDRTKIRRRTRKILTVPLDRTLRDAIESVAQSAALARLEARDRSQTSHLPIGAPGGEPRKRFGALTPPHDLQDRVLATADRTVRHDFDLLGSGVVNVRHGVTAPGFRDVHYAPSPPVEASPDGSWLSGRVNAANLAESRRIWSLIEQPYEPIDWQLDFRSGFRWSETTWYRRIRFGTAVGADIKVPWELGRMQHLPELALAAIIARSPGNVSAVDRYRREFRNQVLDFCATNPPRFGVNWAMPMDVAIRAVNLIATHDLLVSGGFAFDPAFQAVLVRALFEHGHHVINNLEWWADLRANHYLANVVGLQFIAAWLPRAPFVDAWLAFASGEVLAEMESQFLPDGGSFEASTGYHRLAAEMAAYALALLDGLSEADLVAVSQADPSFLPRGPRARFRRPWLGHSTGVGIVPDRLIRRLEQMAWFTRDLTKPDGTIVQIGDHDSGRFLKLEPAPLSSAEDLAVENELDHGHLIAAIGALTGRPEFRDAVAQRQMDGAAVLALGSPRRSPADGVEPQARHASVGDKKAITKFESLWNGAAPDRRSSIKIPFSFGDGLDDVRFIAYPHFGAFVARSRRVFLCIRCGPVGQHGFGGHAHNDQLSIELSIDGVNWIRDPGTYVYTAFPDIRNAYRASTAHYGPRLAHGEPAAVDRGLFELGPGTEARCLYWGDGAFVGLLTLSRRRTIANRIRLTADALTIDYVFEGCVPHPLVLAAACDWRALLPAVPFSPGYGRQEVPL